MTATALHAHYVVDDTGQKISVILPMNEFEELLEALADLEYGKAHPELSRARERRVLLYCDSGTRSAFAAVTLAQMGFAQVHSLAGGMVVWEAEDKPIES